MGSRVHAWAPYMDGLTWQCICDACAHTCVNARAVRYAHIRGFDGVFGRALMHACAHSQVHQGTGPECGCSAAHVAYQPPVVLSPEPSPTTTALYASCLHQAIRRYNHFPGSPASPKLPHKGHTCTLPLHTDVAISYYPSPH
eukprot:361314-Chlamydomonas_euryale.AAC.3